MPIDGRARGIPKRSLPYGTVEYLGGGLVEGASIAVTPTIGPNDFIVIASGCLNVSALYSVDGYALTGMSPSCHFTQVEGYGPETVWLGSAVPTPGQSSYGGTVHISHAGTSYQGVAYAVFRRKYGFQGRFVRGAGAVSASNVGSLAVALPTPTFPPGYGLGGLLVAAAFSDDGSDISSMSGVGWTRVTGGASSLGMGFYILPMDANILPPAPTFSCAPASERWANASVLFI
jgi:hypothetical protein